MRRSGATLLAVQSKGGGISVGPADDAVLKQGDIVVAMGTLDHLEALAGVLRPVERAR
jgi:K+/H+ antiporter YhaU regulatory subunit KhtT